MVFSQHLCIQPEQGGDPNRDCFHLLGKSTQWADPPWSAAQVTSKLVASQVDASQACVRRAQVLGNSLCWLVRRAGRCPTNMQRERTETHDTYHSPKKYQAFLLKSCKTPHTTMLPHSGDGVQCNTFVLHCMKPAPGVELIPKLLRKHPQGTNSFRLCW